MTKFAIEGLSETLDKEVAPFGIGVTVVEPGGFRTDFRGPSMKASGIRLTDYAETAGKARDNLLAAHGQQLGDPILGATAIITALEAAQPPLHLVIGGDALDLIRQKLSDLNRDLDKRESLSRSTNFRSNAWGTSQPYSRSFFIGTAPEWRHHHATFGFAGFRFG